MAKGFPRIDEPKHAGKPTPAKPNGLYRLYFKGMVGEDPLAVAGLGIAICGEKDDVLFQMKTPIFGSYVTELEAELRALKRGLTEAVGLGINHISIYCDYQPIYRLITGRSVLEESLSGMLLNEVQHIRRKFASSFPIFVAPQNIRYAYELARETVVCETRIQVDTQKTTCAICLDEDINADQMFSVDKCGHWFCSECVKRHIEVKLLEQGFVRCPQHRCKSKLTFTRCAYLLTPELQAIWLQRIKEDSIPVSERFYCPNPRCSALMSEKELWKSTKEAGVRCCGKCGEPFCSRCKVPWHNNMLCDHYKRLHPNPTENDGKLKALADEKMWRQCGKCQHMIELSQGCIRIKCRCGHEFCYQCGAEARRCPHGHGPDPRGVRPLPMWLKILSWVIFLGLAILVIWYVK
uniref:RBR-type E3 ubiquitin transferase n=1 Tax=Brassica campestris TaxID=3711 RepID=M4D688_BRACM